MSGAGLALVFVSAPVTLAYALYAFRLAADRAWADVALPLAFLVAMPMLWCFPKGLFVVALGLLGPAYDPNACGRSFALRIDQVTPLQDWPDRAVLVGRVVAGSVYVGDVLTVQC